MKAMILAAGFGTRLWPLTIGRTKPAIPFLNRPLIAFTIDYLKQFGCDEIIINLHHEPDSVRTQIGDGSQFGVRIHYAVEEPEILGTSGALDNVREQLENDTFLVVNGKIITDIDLAAALQTHREKQALATLVLRPNPKRERFSEVLVTADDRIEKFAGFPQASDLRPPTSDLRPQTSGLETQNPELRTLNPEPPLMFTGIHILDPKIFEFIPRGVFSDSVRDVYPPAMAAGKVIAAHVAAQGSWYELSTLERYWAISQEFLRREGSDVVMDEGCQIDPGAQVSGSILWQRVRVERGARLTD
ncbi:MAG: NDP-sugar synthase, partial [Acidobacteria bacterium]|nr:NDP-sugar synthase [Acidobacteriota bacterium]